MDTGLFLRATAVLGLIALASAQLVVQHQCVVLADDSMRIDIFKTGDDSFVQLVAINDAAGAGDCASENDGGDETLTVTVNMTRDQIIPAQDCFVEKLADPNTVSLRVAALLDATAVRVIRDMFFLVECDKSATDGQLTISKQINANEFVTADPAERIFGVAVKVLSDGVEVADGADVPADKEISFKIEYNIPDGSSIIGVAFVGLTISANDDFSNPFVTPIVGSCRGIMDENAAFYVKDTFMTPVYTPGTTLFTTETGRIDPAYFPSAAASRTIYAQVDFSLICDDTGDAQCFDLTTYCNPAVRKRRSVTEISKNGTKTFTIKVSVDGGTTSNLGGSEQDDEEVSTKECSAMFNFWIVALVLGILLLAVLIFAVFLFYKLRREQNKVEKVVEKYGVQNPSF